MTDATRDAELLASRDHHDPHRVLGVHPDGGGWSIRTWRPLAQTVVANCDDGETVPLSHVAEALFAGRIERAPGRYVIETTYPDGSTHRTRDPYSFAPTVGSFDLHILGEGRLEELWRSLGAHPHEIDGAPGVGFAVWAPAARSVSVVGDWNGWDGMTHPMRSLGGAGVWELFIPGVEVGARYKFEIRGPDGTVRVKSDPVAAASEAPPRTASVVEASQYRWHDDDWMAARPGRTPWREPVSVYEVHLGSWRRNPLQGDRSLTYRELPRSSSAYVRGHGLYARRAAAGDGASVRRVVGVPGHRVLRAHRALRHAGRLPHLVDALPRARHRRDPRLGAGPFPDATTTAWRGSTAPRSTSMPIRARAPTRTGAR